MRRHTKQGALLAACANALLWILFLVSSAPASESLRAGLRGPIVSSADPVLVASRPVSPHAGGAILAYEVLSLPGVLLGITLDELFVNSSIENSERWPLWLMRWLWLGDGHSWAFAGILLTCTTSWWALAGGAVGWITDRRRKRYDPASASEGAG